MRSGFQDNEAVIMQCQGHSARPAKLVPMAERIEYWFEPEGLRKCMWLLSLHSTLHRHASLESTPSPVAKARYHGYCPSTHCPFMPHMQTLRAVSG